VTGTARVVFALAAAENGVIGRAGRLPWHLPSDLRHFRALTLGKPLIMGRKTYQSIGRPLEGRDTIVLTRSAGSYPPGVRVATSLEEALSLARTLAQARGAEEIVVIGGVDVFHAALAHAQRIYLTLVRAAPAGDQRVAPFAPETWREIARQPMPRGPGDEFAAEFLILERVSTPKRLA
jgi:dihydrofolate reductase